MPDNTPGLDSTTKGDLSLISWQGAVLLCELFAAIEGGAKWPTVLTLARTAFLSKGEDDLCPTGFRRFQGSSDSEQDDGDGVSSVVEKGFMV